MLVGTEITSLSACGKVIQLGKLVDFIKGDKRLGFSRT